MFPAWNIGTLWKWANGIPIWSGFWQICLGALASLVIRKHLSVRKPLSPFGLLAAEKNHDMQPAKVQHGWLVVMPFYTT